MYKPFFLKNILWNEILIQDEITSFVGDVQCVLRRLNNLILNTLFQSNNYYKFLFARTCGGYCNLDERCAEVNAT